jgi:hypothetical protein
MLSVFAVMWAAAVIITVLTVVLAQSAAVPDSRACRARPTRNHPRRGDFHRLARTARLREFMDDLLSAEVLIAQDERHATAPGHRAGGGPGTIHNGIQRAVVVLGGIRSAGIAQDASAPYGWSM